MTDTSYEVGGATLYQVEDGWIELGSGLPFYFGAEPPQLASMMLVEDIAQSLSRLCRYNGHTKRHYSVAEHCILMADYVDRQGGSALDCLTALHHDDAEYIIGDLPRPVKYKMPQFKELETRLDEAVAIRFETIWPMPPWLKELDARILVDERDQRPIREIAVYSHDGRVLKKGDLKWALPQDVASDVAAAAE